MRKLLVLLMMMSASVVRSAPTVIIKADDIYYLDDKWIRFFDCVVDKGISVSVGVLGQYIDNGSTALINRMKELHADGTVEFWNHGYTHRKDGDGNPEFQNQTYESQLATMRKTQDAGKNKLGITFTAFAATFNKIDVNTARAVRDCGDFGVWMYGLDVPEKGGDVVLLKRKNIEIEYPTLQPDYAEFLAEYGAVRSEAVLTLQCHPGYWNDTHYNEFVKIIDHLIADGCRFDTPSRYCGVEPVRDTVPPADTSVAGIRSSGTWQGFDLAASTDRFTVSFDATPLYGTCNGLFALSPAAAGGYDDCAVLVRFNNAGRIDARNGGDYAAVSTIAYAVNTVYGFEVSVDLAAHRYGVTVTPAGGTPAVIAEDYAFRTDQADAAALGFWNIIDDTGIFAVDNVTVTAVSGVQDNRMPDGHGCRYDIVRYRMDGRHVSRWGGNGVFVRYDGNRGVASAELIVPGSVHHQ